MSGWLFPATLSGPNFAYSCSKCCREGPSRPPVSCLRSLYNIFDTDFLLGITISASFPDAADATLRSCNKRRICFGFEVVLLVIPLINIFVDGSMPALTLPALVSCIATSCSPAFFKRTRSPRISPFSLYLHPSCAWRHCKL